MITLLAALVVLAPATNADVEYSGFPTLDDPSIAVLSHDVRITIQGQTATVTSLTLFKNLKKTAVSAGLVVPRYRFSKVATDPDFNVTAIWGKAPLPLEADPHPIEAKGSVSSPLRAEVEFGPGATFPLRISYQVPIGRSDYAQSQRIAAYQMPTPDPTHPYSVPQVNVSFAYTQHDVYNLPVMTPSGPWQIGHSGAFARYANYAPHGERISLSYYPAGFG